MDFKKFSRPVHVRLTELSKDELYVVGDGDALWQHYLASWPEGTNPIYRKRTEHDCSCCRNFVRNMGNVVGIKNGQLQTIWSVPGLPSPYKEVAQAMHDFVVAQPIVSVFRTKQGSYGAEVTREALGDGAVRDWNHFFGTVARRHLSPTPAEVAGNLNTTAQVFRRGLTELTPDAVSQVLDLIASNSLYRGEEHLRSVREFKEVQTKFLKLKTDAERVAFSYENVGNSAARFRNTVIGTLVQDLSAGVELERAVGSFEQKVAPTNYRRTTALITPRMVKDAMKTIADLGLESALERRLAVLSDVSVRDVLWVDRSVRGHMKGGIESLLLDAASVNTDAVKPEKATDITISDFMNEVVPNAVSMDVYLRSAHAANFVTLTAPKHADSARLFKWANGFGWSYDGNVTDSIREKVKRAGGDVDAKLRFSLAWFNYDDLDFHVKCPDGKHYSFMNRGNVLDVDMNAGGGRTREPVENLRFTAPRDGQYQVWVNQFSRRETTDVGFTVEIADANGSRQVSYKAAVSGDVQVGVFTVKGGVITDTKFGKGIVGSGISIEKWGVRTESMVKVNTLMFSPNHWGDQAVGNKHWFFILDKCATSEPVRGIYNEFLLPELDKHRKVFEVLGDKTKCPVADEQLSGLGFSSTRGDTVTVAVKFERGTRQYNVTF